MLSRTPKAPNGWPDVTANRFRVTRTGFDPHSSAIGPMASGVFQRAGLFREPWRRDMVNVPQYL